MTLGELVPEGHVFAGVRATEKAAVLREIARLAGVAIGVEPMALVNALAAREALGSTGIGGGIALPHARLAGLKAPVGFFARLERAVEFAAIDGGKVDLVFLLVSPQEDSAGHLAALALAARRLREPAVTAAVRRARGAVAVRAALVGG